MRDVGMARWITDGTKSPVRSFLCRQLQRSNKQNSNTGNHIMALNNFYKL